MSVCMITYNHENFIREAIEGVLMQECNFDVELIVANDCSTDATDLVIEDILKDHSRSSWIKYTKHDKNLGVMPNFIWALNQCQGKYIALCEGDDYWTDPLKLQKQVDFLEGNPDYVIHSGNAIQLTDDLKLNGKAILSDILDTTFELKDFLSNNNIITCTTMFRNVKFNFPESFSKVIFGDWFLYVILMNNSGLKVYRSINLYSVYRFHQGGVMSNLSDLKYYKTHILQIVSIHKYLKIKNLEYKEMNVLNDYSLQKYRLEIKDKLYFDAVKTFMLHFKYGSFDLPFKKYLSDLKFLFKRN